MDKNKLSLADYQIFLFVSLLWLALTWASFIMTLAGFFYSSALWISIGIAGIWLIRFIVINKVYKKISREMWVMMSIFLFLSFLFSFFSTPTIFSGRDQGSISEAAIRLEQNHGLAFSNQASQEFFSIYGLGKALNFPGFYYINDGSLTTQFPLVYISWLAIFYALFNTTGFAIANAFLLFLFFVSFFLLARLFLKSFPAFLTIIFAVTSFAFMWFSKYTFSENMALPLLWLSILALVLFLCSPRRLNYVVLLASAGLLCFTRIEGLAFFLVSLSIVFSDKEAREYIKTKLLKHLLLPAVLFLLVFAVNAVQDSNFYIEILKALIPKIGAKAQQLGEIKNTALPDFYALKIFSLYGFLGFFVFGIFGVIAQFWRNEKCRMIPLLVVLPTFIYFMNSHITPDHPWMLRRFTFSLLPVAILYSGFLIGHLFGDKSIEKKFHAVKILPLIIAVFLIAQNLPAFGKYLTFSENKGLFEQMQTLCNRFSQNDLILIDREATGDGWAMISGPMSSLCGKNSAYFFNTQDLGKLDLEKFSNVYLIAPDKQTAFYLNSTISKKLTQEEEYSFSFSKLKMDQDTPLKTVELPEKINYSIKGDIFKVAKD
jgi:hypothetical protein